MAQVAYIGSELDVFANAVNWKRYVCSQIQPYLAGSVLEVGAGIGSNTAVFLDSMQREWVCLEPDFSLAERIPRAGKFSRCELVVGTIEDLPSGRRFGSIIYFDVLEHIKHDRTEMSLAADHLLPGGHIIVLSPAHDWLYTPFDQAIGHYRRYNKRRLRNVAPEGLEVRELRYLDSAGLLASFGNRAFLRSASPTVDQIRFWDRVLIPISRFFDPIFGYQIGKSILAVWQKPDIDTLRDGR